MYIQVKSLTKHAHAIPIFAMANNAEPSAQFVAGQCVCKTCRSSDLAFYAYLEDAKCSSCQQWQNEDPIAD